MSKGYAKIDEISYEFFIETFHNFYEIWNSLDNYIYNIVDEKKLSIEERELYDDLLNVIDCIDSYDEVCAFAKANDRCFMYLYKILSEYSIEIRTFDNTFIYDLENRDIFLNMDSIWLMKN